MYRGASRAGKDLLYLKRPDVLAAENVWMYGQMIHVSPPDAHRRCAQKSEDSNATRFELRVAA